MAEVDDLDVLFAEAAEQRVMPSAALMARILSDADLMQPGAVVPVRVPRGWLATLADWFGGGVSLAGMSAAAMTGLYLGVAQPVPVLALAELVTGTTVVESLDLLPATGTLWAQE